MLFPAHSGLRYAVLLAGIIALIILRWGGYRKQPFGRADRIAGVVFTALLDLQVLLGIATVLTRPWQPALIGHITLMVAALLSAHGLGVAARRAPTDTRRYNLALLAVLVPLLLIVAGIMAIGRRLL
ncbi:MAG: hypothetical protein FIB01_06430 [Gemmatimonadetes bacterium]|nr:hypothetical protein [Gemmatimonadota bacterium]